MTGYAEEEEVLYKMGFMKKLDSNVLLKVCKKSIRNKQKWNGWETNMKKDIFEKW